MAGELTSFWLARGRGVVGNNDDPVPPIGFVFLIDNDVAYLTDQDGAYFMEAI